MKRILTLGLALLMLILAGCSTEVTEYRQQQPALDIFHYFQGRTEAWGMVQDRSGRQCLSLALQHERRGQRQPVAAAL